MSSSTPEPQWQRPAEDPYWSDPHRSDAHRAAEVLPAETTALPYAAAQPRAVAPGWYQEPGKPGVLRYWNGASWEEWRKPLVAAPTVDQGQKSVGIAYLLALLVGGLGIHNFYLGRIGPAVTMLVLWILGLLTAWIVVGFFFYAVVGVWLLVDLCLIPGYVRTANLKAVRAIR